jgi:hypothetical protein
VLTHRNAALAVRNRMSLAIMGGSPLLVVAMFVVLFERDAFGSNGADPTASVAITYWIAFAGFFFGLTFGLLQICTELAILRRERFTVVDAGPYLLAKAIVLIPVLLLVDVTMLATLFVLGRLPEPEPTVVVQLLAVVMVDSLAGLSMGLLASAVVSSPAQAALALPMLCFPAVLFSGGVLPVHTMPGAGRLLSLLTSDRFAFEAIGRVLDLDTVLGRSEAGRAIAVAHGGAFTSSALPSSLAMVAFVVALLVAAQMVVRKRTTVH